MSVESDEQGMPERDGGGGGGVERIIDPDDYNTRRRLKQLHDAKEFVREVKNRVIERETNDPRYDMNVGRRNLAEVVADYLLELRPVLRRNGLEEQFLDEEIDIGNGDPLTFRDFAQRPWYLDRDGNASFRNTTNDAPTIRQSMRAWDICNDYLEEIAGAMFEDGKLPRESEFTSTNP